MYHIYQTEGWVLGGINVGEANRYIDIFTRELGLVRGVAQGVRKLQSKLKFGLQDLTYGKFSLVKGREVWRIVGAEALTDFENTKHNKEKLALLAKIFLLVDRLIKGERKDAELFDDIYNAFKLVYRENLSSGEVDGLELVLVYRILHNLGYVSYDSSSASVIEVKDWNIKFLNIDKILRVKLLKQINEAIAHSHL